MNIHTCSNCYNTIQGKLYNYKERYVLIDNKKITGICVGMDWIEFFNCITCWRQSYMDGIDIAKEKIGSHEVREKENLRHFFKTYARSGDIDIDPSKTSWCAAFINACERAVGYPGTGKLNAQSFNTYGKEVNQDDAQEGDIVVFHFASDEDWQGHVTYFVEWDDDTNTVKCLGGNQDNQVKYSNYSQDAIRHIRRYD